MIHHMMQFVGRRGMILDPLAASIMSAVGEIEHELGTMEALLAPPRTYSGNHWIPHSSGRYDLPEMRDQEINDKSSVLRARDPGHLARWNAGLSELKSGLDIMTRLAHDIETGVK